MRLPGHVSLDNVWRAPSEIFAAPSEDYGSIVSESLSLLTCWFLTSFWQKATFTLWTQRRKPHISWKPGGQFPLFSWYLFVFNRGSYYGDFSDPSIDTGDLNCCDRCCTAVSLLVPYSVGLLASIEPSCLQSVVFFPGPLWPFHSPLDIYNSLLCHILYSRAGPNPGTQIPKRKGEAFLSSLSVICTVESVDRLDRG